VAAVGTVADAGTDLAMSAGGWRSVLPPEQRARVMPSFISSHVPEAATLILAIVDTVREPLLAASERACITARRQGGDFEWRKRDGRVG
jgi:hypothetical protein